MHIGLIGCGRVGLAITSVLMKNNQIIGVYDTSKRRQKLAARSLNIRDNPTYMELINRSEVLLIATPDDSITRAYTKMSKHITGSKSVFHFSGILPADIMPKRMNTYRASIHPFATFPETSPTATRQHFFMSMEGDPQALRAARQVFCSDNFTLRKIKKEDKPVYHLIGVFSSNLLVGLIASVNGLSNKIGWRRKEFLKMIIPLIEETVNNIKTLGAHKSLSGPLRRGDAEVVKKHLATLKNDKNLLQIYKALSRAIVKNLAKGGKTRELDRLLR